MQRSQTTWSFSHLTIQEYLTALWYVENQKIDELVSTYLFDERWREVFMLVAGVVGKADDFLERIHKAALKQLEQYPESVQLVQWAARVVVPAHDEQSSAARRAFALTLALARARALDLARPIDLDLALDLARALDRDRDRALDLALDLALALDISRDRARDRRGTVVEQYINILQSFFLHLKASRILQGKWLEVGQQIVATAAQFKNVAESTEITLSVLNIFFNALELPPGLYQEGGDGWVELHRYMYVCQLIVSCRHAASRVTEAAWEKICRRMCSPPERVSMTGTGSKRKRQAQRR